MVILTTRVVLDCREHIHVFGGLFVGLIVDGWKAMGLLMMIGVVKVERSFFERLKELRKVFERVLQVWKPYMYQLDVMDEMINSMEEAVLMKELFERSHDECVEVDHGHEYDQYKINDKRQSGPGLVLNVDGENREVTDFGVDGKENVGEAVDGILSLDALIDMLESTSSL